MPICGKIQQSFLYDCDNPPIGGVEAIIYLINKEDIVSVTRNNSNPQIIEDITLEEDAIAYSYEGFNTSVKPKAELVKKEYSAKYNHEVDFLLFTRGATAKQEIEALANGRYVAIIENMMKSGNVAFEIYGLDVGLELKTAVGDPNDQNNEGAYALKLGSPENFKETHMPATLFLTSYTVTKQIVEDLVAERANTPSAITLAVGSAQPVGGVTNVSIPSPGEIDETGAVTGWTTGSADKIKITVTDVSPATSTIKINGASYTSGTNYTIAATGVLQVVVTTTQTGKATATRVFLITVSA